MTAPSPAPTPEQLLHTDDQGAPISVEDLVCEGLGGGYAQRVPALVELMRSGAPRDRLFACSLLVGWGVPEGFDMLLEWAAKPAEVPWKGHDIDRWNVDVGFQRLHDSVMSSSFLDPDPELERRQQAAEAALGPLVS